MYPQALPRVKGKTARDEVNVPFVVNVSFVRNLLIVLLVNMFPRKTWAGTASTKFNHRGGGE